MRRGPSALVEPLPLASVERLCDAGALAVILSGAAAFLALTVGGQTAQYGRHAPPSMTTPATMPTSSPSRRRRRGLSSLLPASLPARWAWLTQELPALLLAPAVFVFTLRALHENEKEAGAVGKFRWWFSSSPPPVAAAGRLSSLLRLLSEAPLPNRLLLLAFALHYAWRSLAYPFLIRGGKRTRVLEWLLALAFCCCNGALQGAGAALVGARGRGRGSGGEGGRLRSATPPVLSPFHHLALFGVSLCLWALFWGLNLAADAHLRSLRRKKTSKAAAARAPTGNGGGGREEEEEEEEEEDRGYRLPTSALFSLVACPNYGAECAEWGCFSLASFFASRATAAAAGAEGERSSSVIASESLPALAFAFFTAANLVPRALAHRRWYAEKFEDFPRGRRAIFPWVL